MKARVSPTLIVIGAAAVVASCIGISMSLRASEDMALDSALLNWNVLDHPVGNPPILTPLDGVSFEFGLDLGINPRVVAVHFWGEQNSSVFKSLDSFPALRTVYFDEVGLDHPFRDERFFAELQEFERTYKSIQCVYPTEPTSWTY